MSAWHLQRSSSRCPCCNVAAELWNPRPLGCVFVSIGLGGMMFCPLVMSIVSEGMLTAGSGAAEVEPAVAVSSSVLKHASNSRYMVVTTAGGILFLPLITGYNWRFPWCANILSCWQSAGCNAALVLLCPLALSMGHLPDHRLSLASSKSGDECLKSASRIPSPLWNWHWDFRNNRSNFARNCCTSLHFLWLERICRFSLKTFQYLPFLWQEHSPAANVVFWQPTLSA